MLSILWMMIKILLLVLASILGLAFLVLLLLLFVPIRYEIHMERQESFWMKGRLSWFFCLVRLPAGYENGELTAKLKILGFTWKNFFAKEQKIKETAREIFAEEEVAFETPTEKNVQPKAVPEMPAGKEVPIPVKPISQENAKPSGRCPLFFRFLKSLASIPRKIKNLRHSLRRCRRKIQRLKRFATDERTKTALSLIWEETVFLLHKLRPKKLRGRLYFGTEDPALTGEILGGLSLFYPIFQEDVQIEPNFSEKVLEGELHAKGCIRIFTLIQIVWKLYRDPNVQFVYRMVT